MRKVQKILLGIFLGGVLLGGIGTGVALVEYSSLAYGGERLIGEEGMVTREIDYTFVPGEERISIVSGYWIDGVEVDDTVPEGIIRYEVTYNEKTVEPSVCSWEASKAQQEAWEDENQVTEYEVFQEDVQEAVMDAEETEVTNSQEDDMGEDETLRPSEMRQTCLEFRVRYIHSDFAVLMECKDEILAELKQKRIFNYQMSYVAEVRIMANSKTIPYIRSQSTRYSVYP